jgi:hypothetical protein
MSVRFVEGWPVRSARVSVPGLVADHVMPRDGYICLWAEDDPAQMAEGMTLDGLLKRLTEWAEHAVDGFDEKDRALDAWAVFPGQASLRAELDLPALLAGNLHNGTLHPLHGKATQLVAVSRQSLLDHPLKGIIYYRSRVKKTPRTFSEFRSALTDKQKSNLDHGLARRQATPESEPSGGYDFAILAWPKYEMHEALMLSFSGTGESLECKPNVLAPADRKSRLKRAGPDSTELLKKRVLIAGVGSVGGQVAVALASSGVGHLYLHDSDALKSINLVRHVSDRFAVGYSKTSGIQVRIEGTAPWCEVGTGPDLPHSPAKIAALLEGFDLVIDCSGSYSVSTAIAQASSVAQIPLISTALYHHGNIFRIRRQTQQDLALFARTPECGYPAIPDDTSGETFSGFLELGCTSPVHNASPAAAFRAAADTILYAIDTLTGRNLYGPEVITVLSPLRTSPFDCIGTINMPLDSDVCT